MCLVSRDECAQKCYKANVTERLSHEKMHNRLNSKVQLIRLAAVRGGDRGLLNAYLCIRVTACPAI